MMSKRIYALVFNDSSIPMDFTIYDSFEEALKRYIEYCLHETRMLLLSEEVSLSSGDKSDKSDRTYDDCDDRESKNSDDELSCTFQVLEKYGPSTEYMLVKEYDMDFFLEEFIGIGHRDNIDVFLNDLDKIITDDNMQLPQEVLDAFTPNKS